MPEIVTRGELTGPVLQYHNLRVTVEAGDSKRVRCRWPKTFRECHLICWTDGLSAEEYDQVVVESLLDLIENIVIERLCQVDAGDLGAERARHRSDADRLMGPARRCDNGH